MFRRDFNALLPQGTDLIRQVLHVDYHAGAHHIHRLRTQNAGGKQIQDKLTAFVHYGMSGVIAALVTRYNIALRA